MRSISVLSRSIFVLFLALPAITFISEAQSGPAAFTVTSIADDATGVASNCNQTQNGAQPLPNCNLRDAFAAVAALKTSSAPTINFARTLKTSSGTITPTAGNPATYTLGPAYGLIAYASMNIVGPGASILTLSGARVDPIIQVFGGTVSISGLTFTQGNGGNGGAIANYSNLTVSDCFITNSSATDSGGGIGNSDGNVTVINSTFTGNSSASNAGAIDNHGNSFTIIGSTFANNTALYGGAIENDTQLVVINSTFFDNSATFGSGGAIDNYYGDLTAVGSTFVGNSSMRAGGAIFTGPSAAISNSIISGNSAPSGGGSGIGISAGISSATILTNDVISDSVVTAIPGYPSGTFTNNKSVIVGVNGVTSINIALAPLANYGGSTQTMIPLPGSQAICAGTPKPGVDPLGNPIVLSPTDQRGQPRSNSSYPGYAADTPCVDAGAVQTAYSLSFTSEPPLSVDASAAFNAEVTVDESGSPFIPGVQVPLSLNQNAGGTAQLTGGTAATVSGIASYSLSVSRPGTNDSLTSSLVLNGTLNAPSGLALTATSDQFDVKSTATPPFGNLESAVDSATGSTTVLKANSVRISGWVADQTDGSPLSNVKVYIDGALVGTPTLGIARPDVAAAFRIAAYNNSGYQLLYSAATLSAGTHSVTVIAIDSGGRSTTFGPRTITVTGTPPFGNLEAAVDSVTGSTTVLLADSVRVSGWVADNTDGAPLGNVKVYIDGTPVGTPTLGIARPDVASAYSNSAYTNSGYQLLYSAATLSVGTHSVTLIAIDSGGSSTTFGPRTITVTGTPPFGNLEAAVDNTTGSTTVLQADSVRVAGWVADKTDGAPLGNVKVYIDGTLVGTPTLGIARPDVAAAFSSAAYTNSGYQLLYSAATLSAGAHSVTVVAIDSGGSSTTFGPRTITVTGTPPFGNLEAAVDNTTGSTTVLQADSVRVAGWVADKTDGAPLSNVKVYIDGALVGTPTLGISRPDVAAALSNTAYTNSGYQLLYSAATLSAGTHAVTVIAIDSGGSSTTFGPRTITVTGTPPFGNLEAAVDNTTGSTTVLQADSVRIAGWVADKTDGAPLGNVKVYIDGALVGTPMLGIARPDVAAAFSNTAYTNSGYQLLYSAATLSAGTHSVTVIAIDSGGSSTTFGPRTISVQ